jgi:hypothetical protein
MSMLLIAAIIVAASVICAIALFAGVVTARAAVPPDLAEEPLRWEPRHPNQSKGTRFDSAPAPRA